MADTIDWTIEGSGANPLIGTTDRPEEEPQACVVLMHGYMGYKDYGFLPVLGTRLAGSGAVVHRFNFAYSGMTNETATFARPELFGKQTWNAQVFDVLCVLDAIADGRLECGQGPTVLIGHSRGGVVSLLTAGRHRKRSDIHGVVTLASPDACCSMDTASRSEWLTHGTLDARSSRTGQTMPIASRWLEEPIADPAGHDVLGQAERIRVPVLAVHGREDTTVDPGSARRIAEACPAGSCIQIPETNHVFSMPNPPVAGGHFSTGFTAAVEAIEAFLGKLTDNHIGS